MPGDTPDYQTNPLVRVREARALCDGGIEMFDSAHVCGALRHEDYFELKDNPTCDPA